MSLPLFSLLLLLVAQTSLGRPMSSPLLSTCSRARYPSLCIRTLSQASPKSPTDLAVVSISASLASVRSTLSSLHTSSPGGPLRDCLQQLSDSADQLSRTIDALTTLSNNNNNKDHHPASRMQLDNACTWVSAALTNEDTCLDGMKTMADAKLKEEACGRVKDAEKLTSNALYFVARLAADRSGGDNKP